MDLHYLTYKIHNKHGEEEVNILSAVTTTTSSALTAATLTGTLTYSVASYNIPHVCASEFPSAQKPNKHFTWPIFFYRSRKTSLLRNSLFFDELLPLIFHSSIINSAIVARSIIS
jgi:hypothetical protein